ncbi:MAG: AAA family ATPase [Deltaproteobacteria bacterium]
MKNQLSELQRGLEQAGYICDTPAATVLYLAAALGKPVLVEGPAGVGKTAISQAYAEYKEQPLIRLQCYEGIDEAKALYEWNYKKQLLHIQAVAGRDLEVAEVEREVFSDEFLLPRPLLQAITSPDPCVLLIDEIDKVDMEFEALLLELLSEYQVSIPELGTVTACSIPMVFITSNASRELSEALKRRCLYLFLDFPGPEMESRILQLKIPGIQSGMAGQLATALHSLRQLDLKKTPSVAEAIDWGLALTLMGMDTLEPETMLMTLNVLFKYREDLDKATTLITSKQEA